MDRLNQLRAGAGGSRDSTLDTSSAPSEAYMTANDSSKYFSLSEDSEFDISPMKDVSLATTDPKRTITDDQLIPNLSPIGKKTNLLDSYKIGKQIEAANILSGGVDIFDDNDNSNDLIIDDNVNDEKSNELMLVDTADYKGDEDTLENVVETDTASKDTEVVLQIDGKNVDAIDIGNGLYLYRKEGKEELAAVQIIDDDQQQPNFKFLKVRENAEGNLEVYEEIQIEVPKEVPAKEGKCTNKNISHVPIKDINKVITEPTSNKISDKKLKTPQIEISTASSKESEIDSNKDTQLDSKEVNFNGKMKFSEARKSPVIGSFTPMTYHSTPNKEGKPLTKTMVDLQLHPSRHSDNVKKTIEVHTDHSKQKTEIPSKSAKDAADSKSPGTKKDEKEPQEKNIASEEKAKESEIPVGRTVTDDKFETSFDVNTQNTEVKKDAPVINLTKDANTTELKDQDNKGQGVKEKDVQSTTENLPSQSILGVKEGTMPCQSNFQGKEGTVQVNKGSDNSLSNTTKTLELKSNKNIDIETVSSSTEDKKESSSNKLTVQDDKSIPLKKESLADKQQTKVDEVSSSQEAQAAQTQKTQNVVVHSTELCAQNDIEKSEITADISKQRTEKSEIQDISKENKLESLTKPILTQPDINTKEPAKPKNTDIVQTSVPPKPAAVLLIVDATKDNIKTDMTALNDDKTEQMVNKFEELKEIIPNETKSVAKPIDSCNKTEDVKPTDASKVVAQAIDAEKKEIPNQIKPAPPKPINNNHAAVPFGKWTEANRQEFLNKIKESKVPSNHSNGKQIKNSNDLNRRDILKKIDSQRSNIATAKAQEMANIAKLGQTVKKEAPIFTNKSSVAQGNKLPVKSDDAKTKPVIISKKPTKPETISNPVPEPPTATVTSANVAISEPRTEINNQDLIDKTIDDIISRSLTGKSQEDPNQNIVKNAVEKPKSDIKSIPVEKPKTIERKPVEKPMPIHKPIPIHKPMPIHRPKPIEILKPVEKLKSIESSKPVVAHSMIKTGPNTLLDDIEMEMNKLHGIPFVERPQHELPQVSHRTAFKTYGKADNDKANKQSKVPKLLPFVNKGQQKMITNNTIDLDSEDEIIEHEPITGDIDVAKRDIANKLTSPSSMPNTDASKKEAIITENDFDKFARRNSKTYENCLKVNFDGSESHNVIQTVVEKDNTKMVSKVETKYDPISVKSAKLYNTMFTDNDPNKNYPSKVKMAYQSVMTAKRHLERPITIIEDKPVKVMYVDSNIDYYPCALNVQGKELAPPNKLTPEIESNAISSCDSLDSDMIETTDDSKSQDEIKSKTKHQRKQVLTPVETPEFELIEPEDLGFDVSPKKKRRTDDSRIDKSPKALVPKKSYLLGRSVEDKSTKSVDLSQSSYKEPVTQKEPPTTHNAASAIDSLVKAAALIETQSENIIKSTALPEKSANVTDAPNPDSQPATPVKRGRGRPRKYPLPEGEADKTKSPSPQKKPRLIDAKVKKPVNISEDSDSSDDEMIKENWTMGKINENIVCPICSKLFRSENVVFKHVKHCTGPSPNRSDSDKRSPRRGRFSQESESTDSKFDDTDNEPLISEKTAAKKRKSKDSPPKLATERDDIIVIEDTPAKERLEKREPKTHESRKLIKKVPDKVNNLVCEICGKTFRQLSYLASHKLQHGKDDRKKAETVPAKSVFGCDVCKKEFRKLHHLVQHRIIHNPGAVPARPARKTSAEQKDSKQKEAEGERRPSDDASAGFRCEPCDKSFRKLHHLVEHRETHSTTRPRPPAGDVCKKPFRKLHQPIEHKEQHAETTSEKSDDKSVKSSLSTKDIIHECSLCYMVFPNEHSLTKHTVICQRKKKQSAAKALKRAEEGFNADGEERDDDFLETSKQDDDEEEVKEIASERRVPVSASPPPSEKNYTESKIDTPPEMKAQVATEIEKPKPVIEKAIEKETIITEPIPKPEKEQVIESASKIPEDDIPTKIKKIDEKDSVKTPKKKTPVKVKCTTVTKRQKSINVPLPVVEEAKPVDSSDDDEIRYMLNPDFKVDDTIEGKIFMKVRAKKRNSLQIERPNSKDLVKRRISLQHPPKIPRLKPKPVEPKVAPVPTPAPVKSAPKEDPVPSTDSDDSDIKYSFPKTACEKKAAQEPAKEPKKARKSLAEKRKSLVGIAKRKSMGKAITAKHKDKPSPLKPLKRRTTEVEHRCDCGQLFSSAALLSRHTTLAHTPPRLRRRRASPPARAAPPPPAGKPPPTPLARTSSTRSDASAAAKQTRRSTAKDARKSIKVDDTVRNTASGTKTRRSVAHRGVPVPEKMRKLMDKHK